MSLEKKSTWEVACCHAGQGMLKYMVVSNRKNNTCNWWLVDDSQDDNQCAISVHPDIVRGPGRGMRYIQVAGVYLFASCSGIARGSENHPEVIRAQACPLCADLHVCCVNVGAGIYRPAWSQVRTREGNRRPCLCY